MKKRVDDYNIYLIVYNFTTITRATLKKFTDRGMYLMLRIESSTDSSVFHAHFVIVGMERDSVLIKNSWGEVYGVPKVNDPFQLGKIIYDGIHVRWYFLYLETVKIKK